MATPRMPRGVRPGRRSVAQAGRAALGPRSDHSRERTTEVPEAHRGRLGQGAGPMLDMPRDVRAVPSLRRGDVLGLYSAVPKPNSEHNWATGPLCVQRVSGEASWPLQELLNWLGPGHTAFGFGTGIPIYANIAYYIAAFVSKLPTDVFGIASSRVFNGSRRRRGCEREIPQRRSGACASCFSAGFTRSQWRPLKLSASARSVRITERRRF